MLKKILSLSLALCMILSLAAIMPVGAAGEAGDTVVKESYYDNFDDTVGTVNDGSKDAEGNYISVKEGTKYSSSAFVNTTGQVTGNTLSIAPGEGVDGSDALKITVAEGEKSAVTMNKVSLSADNYMLATYKVKFKQFPKELVNVEDANDSWGNFGHFYSSTGTLKQGYAAFNTRHLTNGFRSVFISNLFNPSYGYGSDAPGHITFDEDTWYTFAFSAHLRASDSQKLVVNSCIINDKGDILINDYASISLYDKGWYFSPVYIDGTKITEGTAEILLDDCYLYNYTASSQAPSVVEERSTIPDVNEKVAVDSAFTVAFDQYVTGTEDVKIYKASDKVNSIDATVSSVGIDRFTITPDGDLEPKTEYYIDLSSVKNTGNISCKNEIEFTTGEATSVSIRVDDQSYQVTKPAGVEDFVEIPDWTSDDSVTSLSMIIDGNTVTVAESAWRNDGGKLKISNSLLTNGAEFKTDKTPLGEHEVNVTTKKVGINAEQTRLYMLGVVTGSATRYGVHVSCTADGISGDYDAAGANENGEFLVELGYGSILTKGVDLTNTKEYSLNAYAYDGEKRIDDVGDKVGIKIR